MNDTPNAKKLAEKLKSEKAMPMIFTFFDNTGDKGRDTYSFNKSKEFGFETTTESEFFQPYDIISLHDDNDDYLIIVIENTDQTTDGYKIGQVVKGKNDLSEFYSTVLERIDKDNSQETFILAYSDKEVDDGKIFLVISLLLGLTLLTAGYFILNRK